VYTVSGFDLNLQAGCLCACLRVLRTRDSLTECTSIMFCIWSDDVSISRNMSPNF
jgi:hypothetical protein